MWKKQPNSYFFSRFTVYLQQCKYTLHCLTNERPDLDPCQLFLWWKGLTGLAFSYVLWYNGPTEVYDEKISYDSYPLLYGRFVSIYYISHQFQINGWHNCKFICNPIDSFWCHLSFSSSIKASRVR